MHSYRFGCSGWDYEEWIGPFYRSSQQSKLAAYSAVFDTVEINSSFYRAPTKGMVLGWTKYSPEGFRFAAKVPQTVTHDKLLSPAAERELKDFCETMRPLLDAGKLGPLLLQLPPRLRFSDKAIRPFLALLPREFPWALEPRNKTWMVPEAFDLLKEFQVAYTIVDEPLLPADVHVTADFAYFRWHGHGKDPWYDYHYSLPQLREWAPKVQEVAGRAKEVYGFFNNHYHGYAPENCLQVLEMLEVLTPVRAKVKKQLEDFRAGISRAGDRRLKALSLDDFEAGKPQPQVEALLSKLVDKARLERGKQIAASVVTFEEEGDEILARVKDYRVAVKPPERRLLHDCDDFAKQREQRGLCKHLVRVFLSMPPETAVKVLGDLREHRREWTFATPD